MFENLGRVLVRYRKAAVALFVVGILVAGAVGSLIFSRLDSGGYSDPNSDSYKVYEYLRDDLKVEDPAVVVVIDAGDRDVGDRRCRARQPAQRVAVVGLPVPVGRQLGQRLPLPERCLSHGSWGRSGPSGASARRTPARRSRPRWPRRR